MKGYDDIIVDPKNPVSPNDPEESNVTLYGRLLKAAKQQLGVSPFLMAMIFFIPIGVVAFLIEFRCCNHSEALDGFGRTKKDWRELNLETTVFLS